MERQFCINWPAIVEEAKQRRKTQRLTQSQLAKLADVSTPTISHFESGEKDVQVSTAIKILTILGMNDQRTLIFTEHDEHNEYGKIALTGRDGDKVIHCAVSYETLDDHFEGYGKKHLIVFQANRGQIEHELRRKYLADKLESDNSVLLKNTDIW